MARIVWIDTEVSPEKEAVCDIGATGEDHTSFHGASVPGFLAFIAGADYLCGHNILRHDLKYLTLAAGHPIPGKVIDTLYVSPLLFPRRPYHALLKDDKLQVEELNNPVNDCLKAEKLFWDEVNAWRSLPEKTRLTYRALLRNLEEFRGFLSYVAGEEPELAHSEELIREGWKGLICENVKLSAVIRAYPAELSYALALIGTRDPVSVTPPWVLRHYPRVENIIKYLCGTPCREGCPYCRKKLDIHGGLRRIFGYDSFRTYNGEPLQERATQAAVDGQSLLAVFPTGGGKSITFQLPALLQGEAVHGLTVVISPLQSLMKDQVDHLSELGITGAVTINGMMSPVERADACRRVLNGSASLLFISPEQLRSRTIEKMLLSRCVIRFVIDEAHCFSAWGQDFRVDYLYIGDFIRQLQQQKNDRQPVAVSCFTATAKPKVISDIRDYFRQKLGLDLMLFASGAERENLHYTVLFRETDEEKYIALRTLIAERDCPTIIYVSRTRRTREIAERLVSDGFSARPFNGKMLPAEKIENQDAFLRNETRIMVATSAFGMGVDKKDVGLVIHYDISDSLENYVQEAGRAGRDARIRAECFVLYNNNDLDKHFILLNQTKLSLGEIQQVWKAIKDLTRMRPTVCCSPLEIARQAGWDSTGPDMETRVKTAVAALENAGYIRRGKNTPHVYASSIQTANMTDAGTRIRASTLFTDAQRQTALRILQFLISRRSIARAGNDEAESRVDYLADILGLEKKEVLDSIHLMRQEGLLSDAQDLSAWMLKSDTQNRSSQILKRFVRLEDFLLGWMTSHGGSLDLKEINEAAMQFGITTSTVRDLRTLLYFLTMKNLIQKTENREAGTVETVLTMPEGLLWQKFRLRREMAEFAVEALFAKAGPPPENAGEAVPVRFSLIGLFHEFESARAREAQQKMELEGPATVQDLEDALLYLSKIGAMKLEGGFLILYNGMEIHRLQRDNRIRYKAEDYRLLDEFYQQKIQQIHIVGEYANMMVRDYEAALAFVRDYFHLDYRKFIARYFQGERGREINRNITPEKYEKLFGALSEAQKRIIRDDQSGCIVVAAGPGSGKTRVLTHKLASLLLMEDVKHEQLLMLTFSRAAATVFKKRLTELIGNAAHYVEIKTFHSFCFDLLGKTGSLEGIRDVIPEAVRRIRTGDVEMGRIRKSVLVIDEAQDMDENEYALIRTLMAQNEEMRVIAVGDDDQNIYGFRGSDSRFFRALAEIPGAVQYELVENYRSLPCVVAAANAFVSGLRGRMKKTEIRAAQKGEGRVHVTRHAGVRFERAAVRQLASLEPGESSAILTFTNEEALICFTLLRKAGIPAKLVQSLDGFRLSHLMELRFFIGYLDQYATGPVISETLWQQAVQATESEWPRSQALEICRNLWRDFEAVCPQRFRSDLNEFILESSCEDFYDDNRQAVLVSTIHKAKGREFDRVFLLLRDIPVPDGEEARRIYVGMTRAKRELYLHSNTNLFFSPPLPGAETERDDRPEAEPSGVTLQLTHRDVVLNFFRDKKKRIGHLWPGCSLGLALPYLTAESDGYSIPVAKLSRACMDKIEALRGKGYRERSASIRFIVAWREKEDPEECWVILPDLFMARGEGTQKSPG